MKIFLDDEREPVDYLDWVVVRNYAQFVGVILTAREPITFISFDHDLGDDSLSGYEAVKWLCDLDMQRSTKFKILGPAFKWYVHSQNPVGAENINMYLHSYMEFAYGI